MADLVTSYYDQVSQMLAAIHQTQGAAIREAGRLGADAVQRGGLIHIFGTGHSHMLAEELFSRAGGLVLVNGILEPSLMLHEGAGRSSALERLTGYAAEILKLEPLSEGDLMIIASNAGRNAVPVEAAIYARERGLKVVGITSVAHSRSQPAVHPTGQRLMDLCDLVIDNGGVPGDAVLEVEGSPVRVCATSTVTGAFIVQAIAAAVVESLAAVGVEPPVLQSGNLDGSHVHNQEVKLRYGDRIRRIRAYLG